MPSQTISETSLSSVRVLALPVFKSSTLHEELVLWLSKEYFEVENNAAFYAVNTVKRIKITYLLQMDSAPLRPFVER